MPVLVTVLKDGIWAGELVIGANKMSLMIWLKFAPQIFCNGRTLATHFISQNP